MLKRNIFTIITSLIILYLSLAGSLTSGVGDVINIPYIDKIGHFSLYFVLMMVIIIEHRNSFGTTRHLLLAALLPFCFGTLLEFLQFLLTTNRKAEILDAISNSAGITAALFLWLFLKPYYREQSK
ncbi:MAG: VanZ family protein [Bacteroidales bacterium]|nr:VanZ family protein [Bacteroidales bacterium]